MEVCADPLTQPRAVCGDGTTFRFAYRRAEGPSAGLLVYFRGGGGCTDYISCWGRDGQGGAGRRVATLENERSSPELLPVVRRTFGYFDQQDPSALYADFDILYVPYCTGDGGLASREVTFTRPADADPSAPETRTTYFHGLDNRAVVVDFAARTFGTPSRLVIAGSSAGAYASLGAVPDLVAAFPGVADVAYHGEGGVGVGLPNQQTLVQQVVGGHDGQQGRPYVRFVQFSFESDAIQQNFAPPPYTQEPAAFRAELRRLVQARAAAFPDNYRYYLLPGTCHTLALQVALYQEFTRTGAMWRPTMPAVRPNPVLVEDGLPFVEYLRGLDRGSGPFGATHPNVGPDEGVVSGECPLPGG